MPKVGDINYNKAPNVQIYGEDDQFHRAQLVAIAPGEIKYSDSDVSPNVQVSDENGVFHRATLVAIPGGAGGAIDDRIIIKSATIPQASADEFGKIYCYSGVTNATYTHGYIYECKGDVTYDGIITLDPVGESEIHKLGFDYGNHNVFEVFERIASLVTPTFTAKDVASGSLRFDKANEIWYITGYNANGDLLFEDFTVGGTGDEYCLDAYGFVYISHFPDDYEDNHTENYEIEVHESVTNLHWERIDVQPTTRGRFLSLWDCRQGLPETNPDTMPYEYKSGDYYIVGNVYSQTGPESYNVSSDTLVENDDYSFDISTYKAKVGSTQDSTTVFTYTNIVSKPGASNQGSEKVGISNYSTFSNVFNNMVALAAAVDTRYEIITADSLQLLWFEYYDMLYLKININCTAKDKNSPGYPDVPVEDHIAVYDSTTISVSGMTSEQKQQLIRDYYYNKLGCQIVGEIFIGDAPWIEESFFAVDNNEGVPYQAGWRLNGEEMPSGESTDTYGLTISATPTTGDSVVINYLAAKYNYKPTGTSYTGVASTVQETSEIAENDTYVFDGSVWRLLSNSIKTLPFSYLTGQPSDNAALATEFAAKQDRIQYATMPSATIENGGKIVQYIGETNESYTHGYIYECVVTHVDEVFTPTAVNCSAIVQLDDLKEIWGTTTDWTHVFTYDSDSQNWYLDGGDTPVQLSDYGISTPTVNAGASITCDYKHGYDVITWQQLNVQPTPVTSVNGSTGAVTITAEDLGATTASTAVKTLNSANWSNNEQSVYVYGVTATNTVIVSPAPASQADYVAAGIYCSAQANESLTFTCATTPTSNISVNVLILG